MSRLLLPSHHAVYEYEYDTEEDVRKITHFAVHVRKNLTTGQVVGLWQVTLDYTPYRHMPAETFDKFVIAGCPHRGIMAMNGISEGRGPVTELELDRFISRMAGIRVG